MNLQEVLGTSRATSTSTATARERAARHIRMAPALEVLPGLWIRSLIAYPDGRRDTTTQVFWLQGPGFFADLRQPIGAPDFSRIRRLADVTDAQLAWMSTQEAFAGDLQFDGDVFEWDRVINLQPRADRGDRGRLVFEDRVLVERGEFDAYVEHWHRAREPRASGAARLVDETDGTTAYLIRVDSLFMYARGRAAASAEAEAHFATGTTLTDAVRAAESKQAARQLLDFEVAFGQIDNGTWRIERSSLPFRAGQSLGVCSTGLFTLSLSDSHFTEGVRKRHWRIVDLRGDLQTVFYPVRQRTP